MAQLRPSSRYWDRVMTLHLPAAVARERRGLLCLDGGCEHLKLTRWTSTAILEEGCHSRPAGAGCWEEACRLLQDPAPPRQWGAPGFCLPEQLLPAFGRRLLPAEGICPRRSCL